MTQAKDLKALVRARMRETAEPYALARRAVLAQGGELVPPDLGSVLADQRRKRHWTLEDAGRRLGVTKLKVGLLERGGASVDHGLVDALGSLYGIQGATLRRLRRLAEVHREAARADQPRLGRLSSWANEPVLWLATRGRRSGQWHPKSWVTFLVDGDVAYLFEADSGRADWFRNIQAHPQVFVWTESDPPRPARSEEVTSESEWTRARRLLGAKYPDHQDLIEWATPVRITPEPQP